MPGAILTTTVSKVQDTWNLMLSSSKSIPMVETGNPISTGRPAAASRVMYSFSCLLPEKPEESLSYKDACFGVKFE